MTDTNELRRMLDELADETPELRTQEWISGTQHKVRVRRRARWAGAGVAAALVLGAAATVVPQVLDDTAPEPVAPSTPSDGEPGWPLSDGADQERVIGARMNDEGASELRWTTRRPEDRPWAEGGQERYSRPIGTQFCHSPESGSADESPLQLVSSLDGQIFATTNCRDWTGYPPIRPRMVRPWGPRLEKLGVEPGEVFTVTMWLERDGERVEMSNVEFGFLVYWECVGSGKPESENAPVSMACSSPV